MGENKMNREIIFRGKSSVTNEWVYGSLIKVGNESHIIGFGEVDLDGHHIRFYSDRPVFTKQGTIGQFTGLYDKNGKEIYEGDILRVYDGERYFNIVIKWVEKTMTSMTCCPDENQCPLSWLSDFLPRTYEIEVIGNICDNKELLEEAK